MSQTANNKNKQDGLGSWIMPIIFLFTPLMPLGIIMLVVKLFGWAKREITYNAEGDAYRTERHVNEQTHAAAEAARSAAESARSTAANVREQAFSIGETIREQARNAREQAREQARNAMDASREQNHSTIEMAREQMNNATRGARNQTAQPAATRATPKTSQSKSRAQNVTEKRMRQAKSNLTAINVLLVIAAIALYALSGSFLIAAFAGFRNHLGYLIPSVIMFAGGNIAVILRVIAPQRLSRYKRYVAYIGSNEIVSLRSIAGSTGFSERTVARDLQRMIDRGFFNANAYIDHNLHAFVTNAASAAAFVENTAAPRPAEETPARQSSEQAADEYERILRALRKLDSDIADTDISQKIERITVISSKIFATVRDNPQKLPQIRRLMNYYLPTTLKLLESYAKFERQGISGDNIEDAKTRIDRVLDTLAAGFERQLDQLYINDVIDISADINVLENMMARDGLSGSSAFGSAAAAMEKLEDIDISDN